MIDTQQIGLPYLNGPLPMSCVPYILKPENNANPSQNLYVNDFEKTDQLEILKSNTATNFARPFYHNYSNSYESETAMNNNITSYIPPDSMTERYQFSSPNNYQFNFNGNFQYNYGNSNTDSTINSSMPPSKLSVTSKLAEFYSPQRQNNINKTLYQSLNSSETFYKKTNNKLGNQSSQNSFKATNNFVPNLSSLYESSFFDITEEDETQMNEFAFQIPKETHNHFMGNFETNVNPFSIRKRNKSAPKNRYIYLSPVKNSEPLDSKRKDKNQPKIGEKLKLIRNKKKVNNFDDREYRSNENNYNSITGSNIKQQISQQILKNYNSKSNTETKNKKNSLNKLVKNINKEKQNNILSAVKNFFKESFLDDGATPINNIVNGSLKRSLEPNNNKYNSKKSAEKKPATNVSKIKETNNIKKSTPTIENPGKKKGLVELINSPKSPINKSVDINDKETESDCLPSKFDPSDFQIIRQIGEGEYGKIYSVLWPKDNKKYAMKIEKSKFKDEVICSQSKTKIMKDFYKNTQHSGIIRIFGDLWRKTSSDYEYYVIMELCDRDWEQEIFVRYQYHEYYTEKELVNILGQIITTCALLQKNNISHRDIKPQNILYKKGQYKLCDFGEAKILSKKGIIIQKIRGTEMFMSPILFFGLHDGEKPVEKIKHNTYKSDVYSLGMCALFAATLNFDCPCKIRELKSMTRIEEIVNKNLSENYSNNFISFILEMLEVNENIRPDFIELEAQILKK